VHSPEPLVEALVDEELAPRGRTVGVQSLLARHLRFVLLQVTGDNDYYGYDDESTMANRAEAEHAVTTIAALFAPPAG
jgi:hypothetical protein